MIHNARFAMSIFLLVFLSSIQRVFAACDNSKVLNFPVQNVLLSNGDTMRGIPLSAGTPSQAFSVLPQPFYNDTWLYNTTDTFCSVVGNLQTSGCITQRGGLYDWSSSSSSDKPPTDVYGAGGDPGDTINVIGQWVSGSSFIKDTLQLLNSTSIPGFPIGMPGISMSTFYNTQGSLGMGSNSTMLNALLAAGKVASRSYSWWWGLTGATQPAQMDGQFILGGYDAAKIQGRNYTQALAPPTQACHSGMVVTISDMVLQFPNGTSASFLTPNVLTTCILPEYPLIAYFPWIPYFDTFQSLTSTSNLGHGGGGGLTFQGMLFPPDNVFQGSLTVSISNDFQVTFPNDLLVVPPTTVQPQGTILKNHSVAEVLFGPTAGSDTTNYAILGRDFFQAAYLTVDYDANTFTISQANPVSDTNIVSLAKDCGSSAQSSPSHGDSPNTNTRQTSEPTSQSTGGHSASGHDSRVSTGEIVGAAVGGVLVIGLIATVSLFICLRRRSGANERVEGRGSRMNSARQGSDYGVGWGGSTHGSGVHEAMSKDILEMNPRRSQAELAAPSKATELRTDRTTRVQQQGFWHSSPVELA